MESGNAGTGEGDDLAEIVANFPDVENLLTDQHSPIWRDFRKYLRNNVGFQLNLDESLADGELNTEVSLIWADENLQDTLDEDFDHEELAATLTPYYERFKDEIVAGTEPLPAAAPEDDRKEAGETDYVELTSDEEPEYPGTAGP